MNANETLQECEDISNTAERRGEIMNSGVKQIHLSLKLYNVVLYKNNVQRSSLW